MDKEMQEKKHNNVFKIRFKVLILPLALYVGFFLFFNTWYFLTFTLIPLAKIEKKLFKTPHPYSLSFPSFCYFKPTFNFLKPELNYDFNLYNWYYKEIIDNNLITEKKEKLSYILCVIVNLNNHQKPAEAIKYEGRAFTALSQYYDKYDYCNLLIALIQSYSKLNKFNKAEDYYTKALSLASEIKNPINKELTILHLLRVKASMYEDKKDYKNAEKTYWQVENYIVNVLPTKDSHFIEYVKYKLCYLYKTNKISSTQSHNYSKICKQEY